MSEQSPNRRLIFPLLVGVAWAMMLTYVATEDPDAAGWRLYLFVLATLILAAEVATAGLHSTRLRRSTRQMAAEFAALRTEVSELRTMVATLLQRADNDDDADPDLEPTAPLVRMPDQTTMQMPDLRLVPPLPAQPYRVSARVPVAEPEGKVATARRRRRNRPRQSPEGAIVWNERTDEALKDFLAGHSTQEDPPPGDVG